MITPLLCAIALGSAPADPEMPLAAATLVYGKGDSARCFSQQFLALIADKTEVRAPGKLATVALASDDVFAHPFCLMSGEGPFSLSPDEKGNLGAFLMEGGFLLASAGCTSAAWDASFRDAIHELFPDASFDALPEGHPLFTFLFPCERPLLKDGGAATLFALVLEGRIACIYSPAGLNDTATLSDCCCCTGNEIEDASYLTANILLYALLGED